MFSNAPKVYTNIKPDEIPEVPMNRFLSRNLKPKQQSEEDDRSKRREYVLKYSYSKSGRKVKGRGFLVSKNSLQKQSINEKVSLNEFILAVSHTFTS